MRLLGTSSTALTTQIKPSLSRSLSYPSTPSHSSHSLPTFATGTTLYKLCRCMLHRVFAHWYNPSTSTTHDCVTGISACVGGGGGALTNHGSMTVSCLLPNAIHSFRVTVLQDVRCRVRNVRTTKAIDRFILGTRSLCFGWRGLCTYETSSPAIHITITNVGNQLIIVKTIGDQPHLKAPGEATNPRACVTDDRPNVQSSP